MAAVGDSALSSVWSEIGGSEEANRQLVRRDGLRADLFDSEHKLSGVPFEDVKGTRRSSCRTWRATH